MIEKTFVLLKPDCLERRLVGKVIQRLEEAGLKIEDAKIIFASDITPYRLNRHYSHLPEEVVSKILIYFRRGPMLAMILSGESAISKVRSLVGHTDPIQSLPGTIRGDFGCDNLREAIMAGRAVENIIHASDHVESCLKEMNIWLGQGND